MSGRIECICRVCGVLFYRTPADFRRLGSTNEHCSRACYGRTMSIRQAGRPISAEQRVKQSRAMLGRPNVAATGVPKSAEQRAKQSALMRGRPNPRRLPPVTKVCLQCNQAFAMTYRWTVAYRAQRRFCGTPCWYAYIREHPDKHPSFLGGIEPYYGPNWPEQARRARKRDGFVCQDCGLQQTSPRLDVHHIRARRDFARDYAAANDLANLVTLCKRCHMRREPSPRDT